MDWREYEAITRYIYEALGKKTGVKIEGYGSSCKVKGKSGVDHQIDVLTSHSDGIHSYRTAIECKYWEERINKDIVMKLAGIIEDAGINKGVIVSKRGFTEDGIAYANSKNIGLVELRETEEKDREEFEIGILKIDAEIRRPEVLNILIDNVEHELKPKQINTYQISVRLKDGKEVPFNNYLTSFKNELHKEEPDKIVQKYYDLKGAFLVNHVTKKETQIRGFKLEGKLTVRDAGVKWRIVDEIWLMMKSLFEGKSFTVSKLGMIQEGKRKDQA